MNPVTYDVALTLKGNKIRTMVETFLGETEERLRLIHIKEKAVRFYGRTLIKVDIYRRAA